MGVDMKKIQFLTIKFLLMTSLITVVNARTMISMNGKTYFLMKTVMLEQAGMKKIKSVIG